MTKEELHELNSGSKSERAELYRMAGGHFGWDNIDNYPDTYSKLELIKTHPDTDTDAEDIINEMEESNV